MDMIGSKKKLQQFKVSSFNAEIEMSEVITDQQKEMKERFKSIFHSQAASMNGSASSHLQHLKKNALDKLEQCLSQTAKMKNGNILPYPLF